MVTKWKKSAEGSGKEQKSPKARLEEYYADRQAKAAEINVTELYGFLGDDDPEEAQASSYTYTAPEEESTKGKLDLSAVLNQSRFSIEDLQSYLSMRSKNYDSTSGG